MIDDIQNDLNKKIESYRDHNKKINDLNKKIEYYRDYINKIDARGLKYYDYIPISPFDRKLGEGYFIDDTDIIRVNENKYSPWLDFQPTTQDEIDLINFRDSINKKLNLNTKALKETTVHFAMSPGGSFIYLAMSTKKLSVPLYFVRKFDKGNNLVFSEFMKDASTPDSSYLRDELIDIVNKSINGVESKITVDEKLLERTENIVELRQIEEVEVVSSTPPPPLYKARRFRMTSSSGDRWLARVKGCCLYAEIPTKYSTIHNMENIKFDKKDLRVINLFESTAIALKLNSVAAHGVKIIISSPTEMQASDSNKMDILFQKNKGKTIIVIGHIEGSNTFVSYSADGKKILTVGVPELHDLARKYNVNLFLLGCYTKSAILSNNGSHVGTLSKIRASRAVEQLTNAVMSANTWADFLQNLSAKDIPLAFSSDFMKTPETEKQSGGATEEPSIQGKLEILQDIANKKEEKKEGDIIIGNVWYHINCQISRASVYEDNNGLECFEKIKSY